MLPITSLVAKFVEKREDNFSVCTAEVIFLFPLVGGRVGGGGGGIISLVTGFQRPASTSASAT